MCIYTHISVAISYALDGLGYENQKVQQIFPSSKPSDRSYIPHILLLSGCLGSHRGIKWQVWEDIHSSPPRADVKMSGAIPTLHLRLHGLDRNKFTL